MSLSDSELRHSRRSPHSSVRSSTLTLEEENELRQFLKLVRGVEWGMRRRRRGADDVTRVVEKLKAIGVTSVSELLRRVYSRTINEELSAAGFPRFSKDTLESIRKQSSFIRALENLNEASYRQVGALAPAPQMFSSTNLVYKASQMPSGLRASLAAPLPPAEGGGSHSKSRSERLEEMSQSLAEDSAGVPDLGIEVSKAFLNMVSEQSREEDAPEDGLTYMPLHLRGARKRRPKRGLQQAMSTSLPNLRPPAEPPMVPFQSEMDALSPSMPNSCLNSPTNPTSPGGSKLLSQEFGLSSLGEGRLLGVTPTASEFSLGGTLTRSRSLRVRASPDTPRLMEQLMRAGSQMTEEQRAARWTSLNHSEDSLLQHGEAMLKEQNALDVKRGIFKVIDAEGKESPLRTHIAKKIRGRLREEQERDSQGALDQVEIQQASINIRKHLGLMSNLRRELQVLKRNAFDEEDWDIRPKQEQAALLSGTFGRGAMKAAERRAQKRH